MGIVESSAKFLLHTYLIKLRRVHFYVHFYIVAMMQKFYAMNKCLAIEQFEK